jgi:DNA-binding NarL/FixJ family response regulator
VDGQLLSRDGLCTLLGVDSRFTVVARCADEAKALEALKQVAVELALIEFSFAPDYGEHFILSARKSGFGGGVVVLKGGVALVQSLKLGARAISLNPPSPQNVGNAIWSIAQSSAGARPMPKINLGAASRAFRKPVTPEEAMILIGICEGMSNRAIATKLGLSANSARGALQRIFVKTGVRKRSQLVGLPVLNPN